MSNLKDDQWRAAYGRARRLSGGKVKKWWDNYFAVREYYEQNKAYDDVRVNLEFWDKWSASVRKAKKSGNFSREQYVALKEIDFPYETLSTGPKNQTGDKLKTTISLKQAFDNEVPMSQEDKKELHSNLRDYREAYNSGKLSSKSAKKLGIA